MNTVFKLRDATVVILVELRILESPPLLPVVEIQGANFDRERRVTVVRKDKRMIRVLVVEDDPSVGTAIQLILNHEGYDAVHALDGTIGMRALESTSFDLAIVDIFLPGINGLKAIAEFRKLAPALPILAISGFRFRDSTDPGQDLRALAIEAGAATCLRKPFAPGQLMAAIHASLDPALQALPPWNSKNQDKDGHDDVV